MKCFIDLTNDNEDDDPSYVPPSQNPVSPRSSSKTLAPSQRQSPNIKRNQTRLDSFETSPSRPSKRQMTMDSFLRPKASTSSTSKETPQDNIFSLSGWIPSGSSAPVPKSSPYDTSSAERSGGSRGFNSGPGMNFSRPSSVRQPVSIFIPGSQSAAGGSPSKVNKLQSSDIPPVSFGQSNNQFTNTVSAKEDRTELLKKRTFSQMMRHDISERDNLPPDPIQHLSPRIFKPSMKRVGVRKSSSAYVEMKSPEVFLGSKNEDAGFLANGRSDVPSTDKALSSQGSTQNDAFIIPEEADGAFEEYDPFDNTEEIAEIRRRQDPLPVLPVLHSQETLPVAEKPCTEKPMGLDLICRNLGLFCRKPYLSQGGRAFLRHTGPWEGFGGYDEKQPLHVEFTAGEVDSLMTHINAQIANHKAMTGRILDYTAALGLCVHHVLDELPGRTEKDCFLFLQDWGSTYRKKELENREMKRTSDHSCLNWLPRNFIILNSTQVHRKRNNRDRLRLFQEMGKGTDNYSTRTATSQLIKIDALDDMHSWKVFKEGSNDILDIAWSTNGMQFALGAATHSDIYNRAGNLVLGSVSSSKVKLLHGHQERRPPPHGPNDPILHSTVPAVGFSVDGRLMFSGGYDKTVRVWNSANGEQLSYLAVEGPIISLSVKDYMVASGCKGGILRLSSWNQSGSHVDSAICHPRREQADLYPAYLAWGKGFNSNTLIVAYDTQKEEGKRSNSGSLLVFDALTQKEVHKITPGATRHFDIYSHHELLITGCSAKPGSGPRSHVRCYDAGRWQHVLELDSPQHDINRVTVSPCGRFLTSSATDGTTLCWDIRMPDEILAKLCHGETLMEITEQTVLEIDDTGIEVALWGESSDRFYTGGSDGVVKIWDVNKADPYVRDLGSVNAQIMSGSFSPGRDMLMIGDSSGTATLFSIVADADAPPKLFEIEGAVIPDAADALEPGVDAATIARDAAAELLRSGRIVIGEGAYGRGAYEVLN